MNRKSELEKNGPGRRLHDQLLSGKERHVELCFLIIGVTSSIWHATRTQ